MTRRQRQAFFGIVALAYVGIARAQIVCKPEYAAGEPIILGCKTDAIPGGKAVVVWKAGPGLQIVAVDDGQTAHAWPASGGRMTVAAEVTYTLAVFTPSPEAPTDPTKAKLTEIRLPPYRYAESFEVAGAAPPPTPPPTPTPEPTPQPPPPGGLASLVPDPASRAQLSEFFVDLAAVVRRGDYVSVSHFRDGYRKAVADGKAAGVLPQNLSAIDAPVSGRITAAIGKLEAPMDADKRAALAAALESIALEFKGI